MTPAQFLLAMEVIFKDWETDSQTTDPATWDDKEENAWTAIKNALVSAGGDPQGKPRRRPGS